MPIDMYSWSFSPPCRAVLMTAKELNISLNIIPVDLTVGEHLCPDFVRVNPCHTVPTIDDNGFILWESRPIMQYLCNRYAPDSPLYPTDPTTRALVDRWLNFDVPLMLMVREVTYFALWKAQPSESAITSTRNNLKLLNDLIGDKRYLVDSHLTIADLSVLSTLTFLMYFKYDLNDYPNVRNWYSGLAHELPYFDDINGFSDEEVSGIVLRKKAFVAKIRQK